MIKADIQDVFEFLICVLTHDKKGADVVTIEDDEFSIQTNYLDEVGEIGMNIILYQKGKDTVAIEFLKTKGDQMAFLKKVKMLRTKCLSILAESV